MVAHDMRAEQCLSVGPIGSGDTNAWYGIKISLMSTHLCAVQATEGGLDSEEVKRRLDQYGYNKLPESTRNPFFVFLGYLWNPLSWAMEVAAILAIILLDYADFCLIIALLLVNATIR